MFGAGKTSVTLSEILSKVNEGDILLHYLGIDKIPTVINSPLRKDSNPSFGFYSPDGNKIYYRDLATKEGGSIFDLLGKMWGVSFSKVLERINSDLPNITSTVVYTAHKYSAYSECKSDTELQCKVREWKQHDIDYWESYGITLPWLKYAEIYPISHKIIKKEIKLIHLVLINMLMLSLKEKRII